MKKNEIVAKAEELGIPNAGKMRKPELIRSIQEAEGYPPSFGNNDGNCPYVDCCWWDDCVKEYKKTH